MARKSDRAVAGASGDPSETGAEGAKIQRRRRGFAARMEAETYE